MQSKTKRYSLNFVFYFGLAFLILSLISTGISVADAEPVALYLGWRGDNQGVGGYLTINNYPQVLHGDQTYEVNMTLAVARLDYADAVEFKTINWLVRINDKEVVPIGFSVINGSLAKGEEVSLVSHWSMRANITSKSGYLEVDSSMTLINSTQEPVEQLLHISPVSKLTFMSDTTLKLDPRTLYVKQGETANISGTLTSREGATKLVNDSTSVYAFEHERIDLVYTNPRGETINRSTSTDLYGNFSDAFTQTDVVGTWFVEAKYGGSDYFSSSTSNLAILHVDYRFPLFFYLGLIVVLIILVRVFLPYRVIKLFRRSEKISDENNKMQQRTKLNICSYCRTESVPSANFCWKCGNKL